MWPSCEGYGEWHVTLDARGDLSLRHTVCDKMTQYGTFLLTEQETAATWQLIRAADLDRLAPSTRPGIPDEVQDTFVLRDEQHTHSVRVWIGEAR